MTKSKDRYGYGVSPADAEVSYGSSLFSNSGLTVKLSTLYLPGSLFSPQ